MKAIKLFFWVVQALVVLMLFIVAALIGTLAGFIGGKTWHVAVKLKQNEGEVSSFKVRL